MKPSKALLPIVVSAAIFFSFPASAQPPSLGNWFVYFGNQKINNRWNLQNEIQYRNYNFIGNLEQLMLRGGIGYNLTENNNNVLLGYAFIHSEPYVGNTNNRTHTTENRVYQQFITRHTIGRIAIQHRYRVEERFLANNVFRMRFRYFTSLNIPLNKKVIEKNTLYLSDYNEIFLNRQSPVFDRDRIFSGLGYGISKNLRLETGIMYQLYENRNRPQWQIILFNNTPFKKKD